MTDVLPLLGSSRGDGNTALALSAAFGSSSWVDLATCVIEPYDYSHRYKPEDAFFSLAERMVRASDIVLATPVYWYAMSGRMKTFIDRWSDLVTVRKDLGRAMAGRRLWLLATSADPEFPPGFEAPFQLTAEYMDMVYGGGLHLQCDDDKPLSDADRALASAFGRRIVAGKAP